MQEDYLKYLILKSKEFAKEHKIFDIVLYGSVVKGKEKVRDIDILLIFENKPLKERTEIAHDFKKIALKKLPIDIKTINLHEFFEKDFLAHQAIIIEGYSLLHKESFSERIGFKGYSLFTYNLMNLDHNKKTRFTYALIGRKKEPGIIKQAGAVALGRGAIKVPIEKSILFEDFLKKWNLNYNKEDALIQST